MLSKRTIARLSAVGLLVSVSMIAFQSAQNVLWGNVALCLALGIGCVVFLLRETPDFVAEPLRFAPVNPSGDAPLSALLDQVPVPLLKYSFGGGVEPVNRAARQLLQKDGRNNDAIVSVIARVARGETDGGALVQLFDRAYAAAVSEVQADGKIIRLISLADVQSEIRMAEATALRDLLRVLSHEIMNSLTPVSSLAGTARTYLDGETSPAANAAKEALELLTRRADGLTRFVKAYRSLSRLPDPVKRTTNLNACLMDVLNVFKRADFAAEIDIEVEIPAGIYYLEVDEAQLVQALMNVLTNAAEACLDREGPGRIRLALLVTTDELLITISDNGCGVPQNLRNEIFHGFVTTKNTGTGTGLNLARQIALAHGGDLTLTADPDWTTTFCFTFGNVSGLQSDKS